MRVCILKDLTLRLGSQLRTLSARERTSNTDVRSQKDSASLRTVPYPYLEIDPHAATTDRVGLEAPLPFHPPRCHLVLLVIGPRPLTTLSDGSC